jgi:hypothetical protein
MEHLTIRLYHNPNTGRSSANCREHSVTLTNAARRALAELMTTDPERFNVMFIGRSTTHTIPNPSENLIGEIMTSGTITIDDDEWAKFCDDYEQLDANGNSYQINEFYRK